MESVAWQSVGASEVSQRVEFREVASAEAMDRARAALGRAVEIGGLVLLEGADRASVVVLLQQVISGLERDVSPLIIRGAPLPPDAFARRVLNALGHRSGDAPRCALEHHAEGLIARGAALLLLVDAADSLPAETVRWLATLTCGVTPLLRVVLAATDHDTFLASLTGLGACVDLVRLETDSRVSFSGRNDDDNNDDDSNDDDAVAHRSQAETTRSPDPTVGESICKTMDKSEDLEADEADVPPRSTTADDHLHTIEELLGEGGWTAPSHSDPASVAAPPDEPPAAPEPLADGDVLPAPMPVPDHSSDSLPERMPEPDYASDSLPERMPEPDYASDSSPEPMPEPDHSSDFSPEPTLPTVAGFADADAAPRGGAGEKARARMFRPALILAALVSGLVVSLALFETQPDTPASMPLPATSVPDRAALPDDSDPRDAARPSMAPNAAPIPVVAATTPKNDAEPLVTDLRGAIELLASAQDEPTWDRARSFLREHGPDAEGIELLDAVDARRSSDPLQAVALLEARSRVRAALCAAWSDDSRGEASAQLGCPG